MLRIIGDVAGMAGAKVTLRECAAGTVLGRAC